jgi:uncharacterized protein (DUF488 family)
MTGTCTLFTTGYAGHDLDSFFEKLRGHGVETIVDVRQNPVSRKKGFSKSRLSEFLTHNGIRYVHMVRLGVPRALRDRLRSGQCTLEEYFHEFRGYAASQHDELAELQEIATHSRACLLCVEERPEDCHRTVVAEVLAEQCGGQLTILHI